LPASSAHKKSVMKAEFEVANDPSRLNLVQWSSSRTSFFMAGDPRSAFS